MLRDFNKAVRLLRQYEALADMSEPRYRQEVEFNRAVLCAVSVKEKFEHLEEALRITMPEFHGAFT